MAGRGGGKVTPMHVSRLHGTQTCSIQEDVRWPFRNIIPSALERYRDQELCSFLQVYVLPRGCTFMSRSRKPLSARSSVKKKKKIFPQTSQYDPPPAEIHRQLSKCLLFVRCSLRSSRLVFNFVGGSNN